jgi:signal transduction histidine kinase
MAAHGSFPLSERIITGIRPCVSHGQPYKAGGSCVSKLADGVATRLRAEATDLTARWKAQARSHAPRTTDAAESTEAEADIANAQTIVHVIADAVAGGASWQTDLMRRSWDLGSVAHHAGVTLHYMLKEVDLLIAMVLYAGERALEGMEGTPIDGIQVARRLHEAGSLLRLTAAKGFTHAYLAALRDRYQTLRHDLRNPLGTIKSAISMMDDLTVPTELRTDPRFRVMVTRNATSLDGMIGAGLSDDAAHELAFSRQRISLRDIAIAVRRDLRQRSADVTCTIEVSEDLPMISADPMGFELMLKSVLVTLLGQLPPGSTIRIEGAEVKDRSAIVRVVHQSSKGIVDDTGTLVLASELSEQTGVRVWAAGPVFLEVPGIPVHVGDNRSRGG